MPTLASPEAFELCEGGTCDDFKENGHFIFCPVSDTCGKGNCYCQLFRRATGSADTVPWEVMPEDKTGKSKHQYKQFDYKCLCVKPLLERDVTVDGVTYAMRYVLCGIGGCSLVRVEVAAITGSHTELKCTGNCATNCKCTLFRLPVSAPAGGAAFDPKTAQWELAAKTDTQLRWDGNYIYRCFCVK